MTPSPSSRLLLVLLLGLMASPAAFAVSLIDSPSPNCYKPDPARDMCFINWQTITVTTSASSMKHVELHLEGALIGRVQGYFQDSISVPHDYFGPRGFRVECGPSGSGSGSDPNYGRSYDWTLQAEDSDGNTTSNFGTLSCPPHDP